MSSVPRSQARQTIKIKNNGHDTDERSDGPLSRLEFAFRTWPDCSARAMPPAACPPGAKASRGRTYLSRRAAVSGAALGPALRCQGHVRNRAQPTVMGVFNAAGASVATRLGD